MEEEGFGEEEEERMCESRRRRWRARSFLRCAVSVGSSVVLGALVGGFAVVVLDEGGFEDCDYVSMGITFKDIQSSVSIARTMKARSSALEARSLLRSTLA